jgi:hypothetical protein
MAKRKFIEVTLGNYSILHGYNDSNEEVKEFKQVDTPKKQLLATDTIVAVDEEYIVTSQLKGRLCFWEYSNSFEEIQEKLCRKTVSPY